MKRVTVFYVSFLFLSMKSLALGNASEAQRLMDKAKLTLETFLEAQEMEPFHNLIKSAHGVFIGPQILKGAFVFGASGGSGVFFVKDLKNGSWAGPSFYTLGGVSFGLQAGGETSEVVLLAMTRRGINALLRDSIKLGADANIAVGPFGAGVSASTQNLSVDILSFSKSKGLFGGISLDGAFVKVRKDMNEAYYGKPVKTFDILIARKVKNKGAEDLIRLLEKATK